MKALAIAAAAGALVALAIVAAVSAALDRFEPTQPTVLVDVPAPINADWPRCIIERGPPLSDPPPGKVRQNYHTRDGGTA